MKQVTSLLFLFLISIAASATGGVKFQKNMTWEQVRAKAAKEKKIIFFDAYTSWCGPCKYLEQSVYTNASVAAFFNANFINVKFDMEEGEGIQLADEFGITAYPTLFFFSPDGKPLHKFIGALAPGDFLNLGKDAMDPAKQYFTLKQKVVSQKATQEDFAKWTTLADELEDDNRGAVASNWLSGQTDILGTAELAKATMLYTDVTPSQLTYLYSQRNRIQQLLGWSAQKTAEGLYRKLFNLAFREVDMEKRDVEAFRTLIFRFDPSKLNYAMKDLALRLAINEDKDLKKGMDILAGCFEGPGRVSLAEFCDLFIEHSLRLEKTQIEKLLGILDGYHFTGTDTGNEWGLWLAQLMCHSKLGNLLKAKELAEKTYRDPHLPDSYKPVLKESFGLSD